MSPSLKNDPVITAVILAIVKVIYQYQLVTVVRVMTLMTDVRDITIVTKKYSSDSRGKNWCREVVSEIRFKVKTSVCIGKFLVKPDLR